MHKTCKKVFIFLKIYGIMIIYINVLNYEKERKKHMGDSKTKQPGQKIHNIKRAIDVVLALALVAAVIIGIKVFTSDIKDINRTKNNSESDISETSKNSSSNDKAIFSSQIMYNEDINAGTLILINNNAEYKGNEDDLVRVYDVLEQDGTDSYTVMSADVKLRKEAADALNNMIKAFASETGHDDIVVDGGYRSVEEQQALYDAAEDKSTAAKPGCSDYHSGYSIDMGISDEEGGVQDFDGTGDYSWFEKNSYKYGYVVRFPDGKKDKTGYDYRPWHFRYVGIPHAYYMVKNGLCLEEYIEQLKTYGYEETHLVFTDDSNNEYEVYYYPADNTTDSTMIAVPSESAFTISGNNTDGFVVCYSKSTPAATGETPSDATVEATAETQKQATEKVTDKPADESESSAETHER